ncbi:MAG: LPS export ABC transporter periplasmic protein LptC [Bdellovibrio sp.]
MSKFKNLLFISLLVVLFVEVLIIFPSRLEHEDEAEVRARVQEQVKSEAEKKTETSSLAEQKMKGVHLVESQQGNRDWELFAAAGEGSQGTGTWKLQNVKVLFYKKQKVEFTVTGDLGTIDYKSKDLSVVGNVVTRSENGYVFKTPSIFYSSAKREIESPEEVVMVGPKDESSNGMDLKGHHMKVFVDQSKMVILDKVVAQKTEKDGKKMEISSNGVELSGKSHEAVFKGAVQIVYDKMKMEGPEASFLYKDKGNILSSVAITGGVRVNGKEKSATAETVLLDLLEKKYTFRGHPKVIQNQDELTGEEITFLEGGKKVKIEGARAKVENKNQ